MTLAKKFSKLSLCDGGLSTLPNDEKVKVEGIREVVVVTHDGVKRKLVDVRYVPKHERNLISLGRLEGKGCSYKASGKDFEGHEREMVLMRGRSESNLYMLQVSGDSLGYKVDDVCKSPKKVTFVEDGRFGLKGEIVMTNPKSPCVGDDFDHLIAHALSCNLEKDDVQWGMRD